MSLQLVREVAQSVALVLLSVGLLRLTQVVKEMLKIDRGEAKHIWESIWEIEDKSKGEMD